MALNPLTQDDKAPAHKFIPKTQTINQDRFYFTIGDSVFSKCDLDISRGRNEAYILKQLVGVPHIQQYLDSYETLINNQPCHVLDTEFITGQTLENIPSISPDKHMAIACQLLQICQLLQDNHIVHGDINVSNLIWDTSQGLLTLIDFETGYVAHPPGNQDFTGPPWGVLDVLAKLKAKW